MLYIAILYRLWNFKNIRDIRLLVDQAFELKICATEAAVNENTQSLPPSETTGIGGRRSTHTRASGRHLRGEKDHLPHLNSPAVLMMLDDPKIRCLLGKRRSRSERWKPRQSIAIEGFPDARICI